MIRGYIGKLSRGIALVTGLAVLVAGCSFNRNECFVARPGILPPHCFGVTNGPPAVDEFPRGYKPENDHAEKSFRVATYPIINFNWKFDDYNHQANMDNPNIIKLASRLDTNNNRIIEVEEIKFIPYKALEGLIQKQDNQCSPHRGH